MHDADKLDQAQIALRTRGPRPGERWRHLKTGTVYRVAAGKTADAKRGVR